MFACVEGMLSASLSSALRGPGAALSSCFLHLLLMQHLAVGLQAGETEAIPIIDIIRCFVEMTFEELFWV